MKNLVRALRMALKYRISIIGSIICSGFVALFWGANLGAVYPFIEVVMRNQTLHDWADGRIESSRKLIEDTQANIAALRAKPDLDKNNEVLEKQIASLELDIKQNNDRISTTQKLLPWIDRYAPDDPFQTLIYIVAFMIGGTLIRGTFLAGNMYLVARIGQRTILDLQDRVFKNVLNMEMSEIGVKGTGDLTNRIRGETSAIGAAITTILGKTIREPMKMAACLTGAALVNWRLLLFSLLVSPIAGIVMILLARSTKRANKRAMEESARLLNRLYQALVYMRIVKSFNMQSHEHLRFKATARDLYKKAMKISLYDALSRTNNEMLSVAIIGLSVLAGGFLVLNQQTHLLGVRMSGTPMDLGQVMLFFAFVVGACDPLRKLGDVFNQIQCGVVAADRVFPIVDQIPAVQEPANPESWPSGELKIEFDNVSFSYEPDRPVLNEVSFSVPAGTSLAIIGPNGCGKSSLINLIPRFFDPDSGSVRINGSDLRQLGLHDLRDHIGYVTQMTMLFGDSIAANISYGSPDATLVQIETAARRAHADKFINQLDDRYETDVGEYGGKLSGGQRQRLSLARAILRDPKILILDEATSQIDPKSETLIHETLKSFIKGRTTVIVTHRMSTLELVDRIMVMDEGRIVDVGSHDELVGRCAIYQRLQNVEHQEAA